MGLCIICQILKVFNERLFHKIGIIIDRIEILRGFFRSEKMKKYFWKAIVVAVSLFLLPVHIYAADSNTDNRKKVIGFLQDAFEAQVSLSEKDRTLEEVKEILSPYFTKQYTELFLKENLVEENGKYFTLGTDFALYYIPFFQFSQKTKIVTEKNQIYVYEFFPGNLEGPVSYESHYEGILLEEMDGQMKVIQYLNRVPETIIQLGNREQERKVVEEKKDVLLPLFLFNRAISKKPIELFSFLMELNRHTKEELLAST